MMFFENIRIGADVEVLRSGFICPGKVRWKGNIPSKSGNWVGVELIEKFGNHSGIYKGTQYFKCMQGYGIFVRPSQLRFPATKGRSYNKYKTVSKLSFVDESLFARTKGTANESVRSSQPIQIHNVYATNAQNTFQESLQFNERKYFPLNHMVGGTLKKQRPFSAASSLYSFKRKDGITTSEPEMNVKRIPKRDVPSPFISSPSIPAMRAPSKDIIKCW